MSKKRVVFIEPNGDKTNVFDNYMRLPLMGSLYLGTVLDNAGYDVEILNENIMGRRIDPFEVSADVFCITGLTVSANRAKMIAKELKTIHPSSLVLAGGIHASVHPEEFADIVDHVVVGEAEEIIVDLVEGKYEEKVIQGGKLQDMENLPLVNYGLLKGIENIASIPIMTSRGCPFDCNFCSVTKVFGKKFRKQSAKRIVAEMENALTHFEGSDFFIYDDNFTADKKRVSEFCDIIIEKRIEIGFAAQVRSDLAKDPELIAKMVKAGLRWVFIGFESINDEILKAMHKSQTRADIERAISTFHEHGVNVHGMFIFGEDHDTVENIRATADFAIENEIDTLQFMILAPLPGTECFHELERQGRLLHKDWDYYSGMYVTYRPKNMSPLRLTEETNRAYRKFYSAKRTISDLLFLLFDVFFDALVWNFRRARRHSLDVLFIRGGAKLIVSRQEELADAYLNYLGALKKQKFLP